MPKDWLTWVGAAVLSMGCGPRVEYEDSNGTTEGSLPSTEDGDDRPDPTISPDPATSSPGSTAGTDPTTAGTDLEDSGWADTGCGGTCCNFLGCADFGGSLECDVWAQDCPSGEKCAPWANDGGTSWNATKCVPLADGPGQPGDTCVVEGSPSTGIDSCDLGPTCLHVAPEVNVGTCVPNCTGTEANPVCSDGTVCTVAYNGVVLTCLPTCNPLSNDCEQGDCFPDDDRFTCGSTLQPPIAVGEPCIGEWDCAGGSTCVIADALPECDGDRCCSSFCDATAEAPTCPAGTMCVPWFAEDPPVGLEAVGVCALP